MRYFYGLDINITSLELEDGNTGWVKLDENGNLCRNPNNDKLMVDFNIKNLGEAIAVDLLKGNKVALGFEAPMWYPIPEADDDGGFVMTARFSEEEHVEINKNGNRSLPKKWYIGGTQAMAKGYPLGFLMFEWMIQSIGDQLKTIKATTDFKLWDKGNDHPLYLYEGFVTGLYKPKKGDFKKIKAKKVLTNDEVADAFIVAEAARIFASGTIQPSVIFPKKARLKPHVMSFENHLRVCVDVNTGEVNSYVTSPNNTPSNTGTPYSPTSPLKAPTRFMSVWKHVIQDANDNCIGKVKIELADKKVCDVYGFKLRP